MELRAGAGEGARGAVLEERHQQQHVLRKKRGSRFLVTGAGTAVGLHWDVAAAEYWG